MLSFLLDEQRMMGADPVTQFQGNTPPVAVNDAVTVARNTGSVSIDVLDNDIDLEGQTLTLVSAFAALGTAVAEADNTVTYTPPLSSVVEFDTVVYEIADSEDARANGQVDITLVDPDLTVTTLFDQTLEIGAGADAITVSVAAPAGFAGTYQTNLADLATGPLNLVPPSVSGSLSVGAVLTASNGLWLYDSAAGSPAQSWQWRRDGIDISGETSTSYTVVSGDIGTVIEVVEIQSDAFGSRSVASTNLNAFAPGEDAGLVGWWDADEASTITDASNAVSAWAARLGGPTLVQPAGARQPTTGVRTLGSRNVIDFDGGDFFDEPITLPASGDVALHMVLAIDGVESAFAAVLAIEATNDFQIDANSDTQFDGRLNASGIGTATSFSGGPFSGSVVLSVICDFTGSGTIDVYVDNTLRASTPYTTPLDSTAALHVMTNRSRNASINGAVGELVISETVTNRAAYTAYLTEKWGLV